MLMKKIFTLFASAALALSAAGTETVTMTLWTNQYDMMTGTSTVEESGTMAAKYFYDTQTKTYVIEDFLGQDEPLEFKFEPREGSSTYNMVVVEGTTPVSTAAMGYTGLAGFAEKIPAPFTAPFMDGDAEVVTLKNPLIGVNASNGGWANNYANLSDDGNTYDVNIAVYCEQRDPIKNPTLAKWGRFNYNLKFSIAAYDVVVGIESVISDADANAPVEYYNLQGMRIAEPAQGQVVIRRQGNNVTKVIVK